jgi:hypothetical protein
MSKDSIEAVVLGLFGGVLGYAVATVVIALVSR